MILFAFACTGQMFGQAYQPVAMQEVDDIAIIDNKKEMKMKPEITTELDIKFLTEFLLWGDQKMIALLKNLNEEEFNRSFGELAGSIHSKTAHILSIYEFFIKIIEGTPPDGFPDQSHLSREELITKWEAVVVQWPALVAQTGKGDLFALPLAADQRVEAQHIFLDALLHTSHHRGQILTFIRLLGKTKEEVHPRDTNIDYFKYVFTERKELVYPAANK